jgi:hypothetical protein
MGFSLLPLLLERSMVHSSSPVLLWPPGTPSAPCHHEYKYLLLPRSKAHDPRYPSIPGSPLLTYSMLRTSRSPRSVTTNQTYFDQLEQEILENRRIRRLLQKARRQSRQHEQQLKDLEESVKQHEGALQAPWAESHGLLNKLRSKDESMQALEAQLSNVQAHTHLRLSRLDHVANVQRTNDELRTKNATLISRVEVLERDLASCDVDITRFTARIERLTARNAGLKKDLENSLRATETASKSLEDWLSKRSCQICSSAEADRQTGCGHRFCQDCLDTWEGKWYRGSDPDGDMEETLRGILKCPTCRAWVVKSEVKHIYHS